MASTECVDAAYCYRCSVVCVSACVCLMDTTVSCANMAEPIEVLFGIWTRVPRVGPTMHAIG